MTETVAAVIDAHRGTSAYFDWSVLVYLHFFATWFSLEAISQQLELNL